MDNLKLKYSFRFLLGLQLFCLCSLISEETCGCKATPYISLDEALRLTLTNQRDILIENLEVEKDFGFLEETAEPFDPTIDWQIKYDQSRFFQFFPLGLRSHFSQFETTSQLNVHKRSRLGTEFNLSAQVDLVRNELLPTVFQAPAPTTNQGRITFQVVQPLLRNFITSADTMRERSALKSAIAEEYQNLQTISEHLLETVNNYWEVVSAKKTLAIQIDAEKRLLRLTKDVIILIKEDEIAENDLNQTLEQLATQKVQVALAKQNLVATIEALKTSMGLTDTAGGITTLCGESACSFAVMENFPVFSPDLNNLCAEEYFWTQIAVQNSFNILASKMREAAAQDLVIGAYNETLPQVDVFGGWSKTNFTVNNEANQFISPLTSGDAQYDTFIGIRISTPFWNDGPIGRYRQREASQQQTVYETQLQIQDLVRDLRTALNAHVNLREAVKNAIEAAEKAQTLVINENIKLKAGESNIFFVVDFETKLTQALLDETILTRQYFQNIAQIRFLTATLVKMSPDLEVAEIAEVSHYPNKNNYCMGQRDE